MTENTHKLIEYRFEQAKETLAVAEELFQSGHYRDAVNRAYYAMFYCSLGLLAAKNLGTSKHSGVLSLFSQNFVKTGLISVEAGRHLREAFELRQNSDYREFVKITALQAEEVIKNATEFIDESQKAFIKLKE
ncbi:MAG: HEPN domain-containing protein [Phycisphaerae bacterium]|nr:HEPN domain-containing protein [Phycisphaerae bacterium]